MNPYKHAEISVKNWGGTIEDYYSIHEFMDCTKELCSDNRHRILHNHWGIHRVIKPIFGVTLKNTDGKLVNLKDLCERDHILPDYKNKFIPTLADFVACIDENGIDAWKQKIEQIHQSCIQVPEAIPILLSPLHITGKLKSLLITHNSWFLYEILPKIVTISLPLIDCPIAPSEIFNAMRYELWMDNGAEYPESAKQIERVKRL